MEEKNDKQHEGTESPVVETAPEPKEVSRKTITVEVISLDNGTHNINVNTPTDSSVTDNLGILEFAKQVLIKKLF